MNEFSTSDPDSGDGCGAGSTAAVGTKSPTGDSRDGLQDMAGNVWAWTDSWDAYGDGMERRVIRGGSWYNEVVSLFTAVIRSGNAPSNRGDGYGFRCSRTPTP